MGLFSRALEELREVMSKDELKHFLPFISGKVHRKWYCCLWMSSPHLNYHGTSIVKCRTRKSTRRGRRDVKYTVIQFDVRHIHLFRSALTLLNSEE